MIGDLRPSLEADAKQYGVATSRVAYPDGIAGAKMVLQEMGRRIREGMITPSMRAFAEMVVRNWAKVPPREQISDRRAAQIFLDYVREHVRYRYDPDGTEMVMAAAVTLCLPGAPMCIPVGDCFPEGTLLLREDYALVPIEEIASGDRIWGRDKWTLVQAKKFKGKLEVDAVEMNNGSTMYLTPEHKVYVGRCRHDRGAECPTCPPNEQIKKFDRISVSDLQESEVLLQPDRIPFGSGDVDPDRAYVEGLALADGWVHDGCRRFHIAGRDGMRKEAQKHEVKAICDRLGIETHWHRRYITVKDPEWAERIAQLGSRARFKRLETINLSEASAEASLRGLMADSTPNSSGQGGRTYSTTSPTMMLQVRLLHRMFGRSTSVKMLTPEQHGGAGKHPLWRVGVRQPSEGRKSKTLAVRSIERSVRKVVCWDIQTEDHYVYLPEHDVTVSNCDDLVVALGSLMGAYGIPVRIMKQSFGDSNVEHVLVVFKDGESGWLPADPSAPGKEVGWRASATKEVIVNPADPASLNLEGQPEAIFVGVGSIPLWARKGHMGAITTTPGDVLAFRQMWDPYVSGVYQAMRACANAWSVASAGSNTPSSSSPINTSQFAVPPDATTLKLWASGMAQDAATLEAQWNYYQGMVATSAGAAQFMSIAPDVLQFFQATVLHAGQYYVPEIQKNCPGIGASIPSPPTFDVQAQIIGQLEGVQIVAKGVLGFMGIGASGALEFYQQVGQKAGGLVDATSRNLPWIAGAAIALGVAVVAVEVAPLVPRGNRSVKRAASEARKLMRRRRR